MELPPSPTKQAAAAAKKEPVASVDSKTEWRSTPLDPYSKFHYEFCKQNPKLNGVEAEKRSTAAWNALPKGKRLRYIEAAYYARLDKRKAKREYSRTKKASDTYEHVSSSEGSLDEEAASPTSSESALSVDSASKSRRRDSARKKSKKSRSSANDKLPNASGRHKRMFGIF